MRSCPHCRNLLDDALGFCPEDGSRLGEADPNLGQTLGGQFVLEARIGEGGCGDVYRAHQLGVERPVAVKLLHSAAARDTEFAKRFAREARAAAQLSHPNIVTIFQLGQTASGNPFIAMEWADAKPIGREESLSEDEVVEAAVQIVSALSEAHAAGIIHRDLKPENVLVGRRGGALHVTLVDFGIAKIVNADLMQSGETHLTRQGVVYGTPMYLSPEQAGDQTVDPRSDLYSVGVMLYELLAGSLPFDSQGMALLVDHLTSEPTHISEKCPSLDRRLASLVMRLLAKDPNARPASATAVLAELRELKHAPAPAPMARPYSWPAARESEMSAEEDTEILPFVKKRKLGARAGLLVALLVWLSSSSVLGSYAPAPVSLTSPPATAVVVAKAKETLPEPAPSEQPSVNRGPQRALMVSASRYSLRIMLPETVHAEEANPLVVELWDDHGEPLEGKQVVMVFRAPDGEDEAVSAVRTTTGRFELEHSFSKQGAHEVEVFPGPKGVSLRVHLDVEAARSANS